MTKRFKLERTSEDIKYALGAMIFNFQYWPSLTWGKDAESENFNIEVSEDSLKRAMQQYIDHGCPEPGPERYPWLCSEEIFNKKLELFKEKRTI